MRSNQILHDPFGAILPGGNGHLPGHLKLSEICYVGSHNSGCSKEYGWIYAQQRVSLTRQFNQNGARYFKIPLHWFDPQKGCCGCLNLSAKRTSIPYIAIAHEDDGKSNCRLSILQRGFSYPNRAVLIFEELAKLAKNHPNEIIILKVETYLMIGRSASNNTANFSRQQVTNQFDELLTNSGLMEFAYTWTDHQNIPILDDLRQGKNVIIFSDDKSFMSENLQLTNHTFYAYDYICQTDWTDNPLSETFGKDLVRVTRDDQGQIQEPLFEAHFNPEASLSITSYSYIYNAYKHAMDRHRNLSNFYNKKVNLLVSDYIDQGELAKVVDDLNNEIMNQMQVDRIQTAAFCSPISSPQAVYDIEEMDSLKETL